MSQTPLETFGPIEIPFEKAGPKKRITDENISAFWKDSIAHAMTQKQGCYIFALKAAKGYTPWYVGKATKTFKQETFATDKIKKYNALLWEGKRGTPVMFFVALPGTKRKVPAPVINDMEKFLIQSASLKNEDIINTHNTKNLPEWSIKGVVRASKGKPSAKSQVVKKMMGL